MIQSETLQSLKLQFRHCVAAPSIHLSSLFDLCLNRICILLLCFVARRLPLPLPAEEVKIPVMKFLQVVEMELYNDARSKVRTPANYRALLVSVLGVVSVLPLSNSIPCVGRLSMKILVPWRSVSRRLSPRH